MLLSSGGDAELGMVDCWVVNGGGNSDRRRSLKGHGWISDRGRLGGAVRRRGRHLWPTGRLTVLEGRATGSVQN
jgi:hypothetical protein